MKQVIVAIIAILLKNAVHTIPILQLENASQNNPKVKKHCPPSGESPWSVFTKISQDPRPNNEVVGAFIESLPHSPAYSLGLTNQIAKILHPTQFRTDININPDSKTNHNEWEGHSILLPVLKQPANDYKVLVAQAPEKFRLTGDDGLSHLVVYVVFPEDNGSSVVDMPTVYFVNTRNATKPEAPTEPVIIMNQNRTVTGIKSKEIEKFVSFRKKKMVF